MVIFHGYVGLPEGIFSLSVSLFIASGTCVNSIVHMYLQTFLCEYVQTL
jgi:hypothetical protein